MSNPYRRPMRERVYKPLEFRSLTGEDVAEHYAELWQFALDDTGGVSESFSDIALRLRHGARAACRRLRAKVADLEDRLDFAGNGWDKALEERDAARLELRALEWLTFESPRQSFSFGFEERATGRVIWVSRPGTWPTEDFSTYASAARALGREG